MGHCKFIYFIFFPRQILLLSMFVTWTQPCSSARISCFSFVWHTTL